MTDPYKTLDVAPSATDEEVKKAYRRLCKQYHPDLNPNNPAAEEKFKEVQAAYDQVMRMRKGGYTQQDPFPGGQSRGPYQQNPYGRQQGAYGPFGGFGFGFDEDFFGGYARPRSAPREESNVLQAAANYINAGHYREALTALSGVADAQRDARWYYFSALANAGLGNRINAVQHAQEAVRREPNNFEYQQLLSRLQNTAQSYRTASAGYGAPTVSVGRLCLSAWLMQLLCGCFCGPRC